VIARAILALRAAYWLARSGLYATAVAFRPKSDDLRFAWGASEALARMLWNRARGWRP
jgi:hypothetical protein